MIFVYINNALLLFQHLVEEVKQKLLNGVLKHV